jgi:hypothetical protein
MYRLSIKLIDRPKVRRPAQSPANKKRTFYYPNIWQKQIDNHSKYLVIKYLAHSIFHTNVTRNTVKKKVLKAFYAPKAMREPVHQFFSTLAGKCCTFVVSM